MRRSRTRWAKGRKEGVEMTLLKNQKEVNSGNHIKFFGH
jgi:hypothetical protein